MLQKNEQAYCSILKIEIEDNARKKRLPMIEQERAQAVKDLLRDNYFKPLQDIYGPYYVRLAVEGPRLCISIRGESRTELETIHVSLVRLRRLMKDYFLVCESFTQACWIGDKTKIETLDMARRGLHNEGAEDLRRILAGKIEMDEETARRIFTLVCVLHI